MTTFQNLIEDAGYETRSYSGRCMYGKSCLGVELDRDQSIGVFFSDLLEAIAHGDPEEASELASTMAEGFRSMRTDSMGMGTIVYFQDVAYTSEFDSSCEEDLDDEDSATEEALG